HVLDFLEAASLVTPDVALVAWGRFDEFSLCGHCYLQHRNSSSLTAQDSMGSPQSPGTGIDTCRSPAGSGSTKGKVMTETYLVFVDREVDPELELGDELVVLDRGIYLVRTAQTQSQLYHAVKRRLHPG